MFLAGLGDKEDSAMPGGALAFVVHVEIVEEGTTHDLELLRGADKAGSIAMTILSVRHMFVSGSFVVCSCEQVLLMEEE